MINLYEKTYEIRSVHSEKKNRYALFCGMLLTAFFVSVIVCSEKSREILLSTMIFCAKTLVPSVFPFAVIGNLIGSGIAEFPSFLTVAVSKIFDVSREGAKALFPGLFAGFPVGVSAAVRLYERQRIDKREFERICAFSCTPGAAFVISGIGEGMFNDKKTGAIIYISVIFSVFAVGFLTKRKKMPKGAANISFERSEGIKFSEILSDAVIKSGNAMIVMTAFVVFFSQITFFITPIASYMLYPDFFDALFKSVIEVSQACSAASALTGIKSVILSAVACAWGGISFQMQTLALCGKHADSGMARRFARIRFFIAVLTFIVCTVLCKVL